MKALVTPARLPLLRAFRPGTSRSTSLALRAAAVSISRASRTVTAPDADETGRAVTVLVS